MVGSIKPLESDIGSAFVTHVAPFDVLTNHAGRELAPRWPCDFTAEAWSARIASRTDGFVTDMQGEMGVLVVVDVVELGTAPVEEVSLVAFVSSDEPQPTSATTAMARRTADRRTDTACLCPPSGDGSPLPPQIRRNRTPSKRPRQDSNLRRTV